MSEKAPSSPVPPIPVPPEAGTLPWDAPEIQPPIIPPGGPEASTTPGVSPIEFEPYVPAFYGLRKAIVGMQARGASERSQTLTLAAETQKEAVAAVVEGRAPKRGLEPMTSGEIAMSFRASRRAGNVVRARLAQERMGGTHGAVDVSGNRYQIDNPEDARQGGRSVYEPDIDERTGKVKRHKDGTNRAMIKVRKPPESAHNLDHPLYAHGVDDIAKPHPRDSDLGTRAHWRRIGNSGFHGGRRKAERRASIAHNILSLRIGYNAGRNNRIIEGKDVSGKTLSMSAQRATTRATEKKERFEELQALKPYVKEQKVRNKLQRRATRQHVQHVAKQTAVGTYHGMQAKIAKVRQGSNEARVTRLDNKLLANPDKVPKLASWRVRRAQKRLPKLDAKITQHKFDKKIAEGRKRAEAIDQELYPLAPKYPRKPSTPRVKRHSTTRRSSTPASTPPTAAPAPQPTPPVLEAVQFSPTHRLSDARTLGDEIQRKARIYNEALSQVLSPTNMALLSQAIDREVSTRASNAMRLRGVPENGRLTAEQQAHIADITRSTRQEVINAFLRQHFGDKTPKDIPAYLEGELEKVRRQLVR